MELINVLLGFVVLTIPLWLIVILLPVSIWVAVKVAKRFKNIGVRLASGLSVFLLVFLVLFGDEIAGKMYLDHLCATEAGVKVYQTVELPAEYWDEEGEPRFFNNYGNLDHKLWVKIFDESGSQIESYSSVFFIDKDVSPVKERDSQKVLAETVTFRY